MVVEPPAVTFTGTVYEPDGVVLLAPPHPLSATRPPDSSMAKHSKPIPRRFLRRKSASSPRHGSPASATPVPVPKWKGRRMAEVMSFVEIVNVLVCVEVDAVKVNDAVEKLHVTWAGSVPHASRTVPV